MLKEALKKIANEYPDARTQPLKGHPLASFIRTEFPSVVKALLDSDGATPSISTQGTKFMGS